MNALLPNVDVDDVWRLRNNRLLDQIGERLTRITEGEVPGLTDESVEALFVIARAKSVTEILASAALVVLSVRARADRAVSLSRAGTILDESNQFSEIRREAVQELRDALVRAERNR